MTSPISNKLAHYWKHTETIKLGGCFKIEWITYACLNFNRLQNITNPLNNNEPIRKSRDTQELPQKEGKEVKEELNPKLEESKEPSEDIFSDSKEDGSRQDKEAARRHPHGRLEATKRHHDLSFERIKSKKRNQREERKRSRKRSSSSKRPERTDTKLRIKARKRSRSSSKGRRVDRKYK